MLIWQRPAMDDADWSQELEAETTIAAVRRITLKANTTRPAREFCLRCSDPIPEVRRIAVPGALLCVDCQAAREVRL